MKDELFKEFDTKFIEIHKFDETDDVLLAEIDTEIKTYFGTSTHGNCCTCQRCKNYHDDCMCAEIDALNKLKDKIASNKVLTGKG